MLPRIAFNNELLPEPTLPTMATNDFGLTRMLMFANIIGDGFGFLFPFFFSFLSMPLLMPFSDCLDQVKLQLSRVIAY